MNRPPHHEKILDLASDITNADSKAAEWLAYRQIKNICETHEGSILDHPFQWETLADYTFHSRKEALTIYFKALNLAENANLHEYIASINLAIAERYQELGDFDKSLFHANIANESAVLLPSLELKKEISELLLGLRKST